MTTVISTVLVSSPVAFMAGWLLSKAVANHLARGVRPEAMATKRAEPIGVDDRDAQIAELQRQLDLAEARVAKSKRSFKVWRERIRPIAQQFRQQRTIISELRDELRRRDSLVRQSEAKQPAATSAAREATKV